MPGVAPLSRRRAYPCTNREVQGDGAGLVRWRHLPIQERPTPNHYERLGVAPSASTDEVRSAYRSLARRLHPDRLGPATGAERLLAERRMREINESWQVLQDPGRRRRYDEGLLSNRRHSNGRSSGPARAGVSEVADDELVDVMGPITALRAGLLRHLPWVVLLVVFAAIFVFSAYATADRSISPGRSNVSAGTCLDTSAGTSTTVVPCSGPHDLQVLDRVSSPGDCPEESEARRLGRDTLFDCVVRSPG